MWAAKFGDAKDQSIHIVYSDAQGNIGGPELADAADAAFRASVPGLERKASPELRAEADKARVADLLPVAVWMAVDTSAAVANVIAEHPEIEWIGNRPNSENLKVQRAMRRLLDEARSAEYAKAAAELEPVILEDGGTIGYVSLLAPLVYVDAPSRSISKLAALERVKSLGLEGGAWQESLASAGPYIHANWSTSTLDEGTGVRVAVIEYYNVRETGDLSGKVVAFHSESGATTYTPTALFDHPTWVAGAIASQDSVNRGIAPGAVIVSSGTGGGSEGLARDRKVISATDWAATTGDADVINLSVNMDNLTGHDEARAYFDSLGGGESF